jgi:hypothetical protein
MGIEGRACFGVEVEFWWHFGGLYVLVIWFVKFDCRKVLHFYSS